MTSISDNLQRIRERIENACQQAGRHSNDVVLVCVSKTVSPEKVVAAINAGVTDLGENYVQEAAAKVVHIKQNARWHLIGHLQRNKTSLAIGLFEMIQSVDSKRLIERLSACAVNAGKTVNILLEINIGGEPSKTGLTHGNFCEALELAQNLPGLRLGGIMSIPPPAENEKIQRQQFAAIRSYWDQLPAEYRQILSMGMSGDFETAILEGSTMVRIGQAIFGIR